MNYYECPKLCSSDIPEQKISVTFASKAGAEPQQLLGTPTNFTITLYLF